MTNVKEYLREAAEHYERHAEHERKAAAMREALELITEAIG